MKTLILAVLIISMAVLFVPACSKTNSDEIQVDANTNFSLPVGKTAVLKGKDISIKFDSVITDSRCASGVTCVWAGEAKCKMLAMQNGKSQEVILTQNGSSETNIQSMIGAYQVSFQLNPYPKAGSQIKPRDYVLTMKLFY